MKVVLNPEIKNWRTSKIDPDFLRDLESKGQLQPIVARKLPNGTVEVIAGNRRFQHLSKLGKKPEEMDIKIMENVSDSAALLIAFSENQQRKDLSAIGEARALYSLKKLKLSIKDIAVKVGMAEGTVRQKIATLDMPKDVQTMINNGNLAPTYCLALRKLRHLPTELTYIARKIADRRGYDRISNIEGAQEAVQKVLEAEKKQKELLAKYGPCPKCGSERVEVPDSWEKEKMACQKCKHRWNKKTRDPWQITKLKEQAADLGLSLTIKDGGAKVEPQALAEIIEERTKAIATAENPNPTIRSDKTLGAMLAPLIAKENVLKLKVDGDKVELKLIEGTKLHFTALRKDYRTGEKSRIVVERGWRDNETIPERMPPVKTFLETLPKEG